MDVEDAGVLRAAQAGDQAALVELVERHQAQVYRFCMSMCRDPEDAAEAAQDTLLGMVRSIDSFRGESALSSWLFAVARSACLKRRRKRKHEPDQLESMTAEDGDRWPSTHESAGPEALLVAKEQEHAIEKAIASLEPMQREVLVLRDVEGLSAPDVANVLGTSVASVKSKLHRARLTVRDRVKPLLAGEPAAPGRTCPDVLSLYSQHLEGEISAGVCETMEAHVARCPNCRAACDSLKKTLHLCQQRRNDGQVPDRVQQSVRNAMRVYLTRPAGSNE